MKTLNFKSLIAITALLIGALTSTVGCEKKKKDTVTGTSAAKASYMNCINRLPVGYQTNCSALYTAAIPCSLYNYVTRYCGNYSGDVNYAADAYFDVYLAQYPQSSIDSLTYQYDHYTAY